MIESIRTDLGDLVERLDHVAMAVDDIAGAARLMEAIGATFDSGGDEVGNLFRWVQFSMPGGGTIELITPLTPAGDDHFLVRFLATRGEGLHHITLKVTDLAASIDIVEAAGYAVVGRDDRRGSWKEAFIHPKSSHGVLIQLAQWDDSGQKATTTLEQVLAGTPDGYET